MAACSSVLCALLFVIHKTYKNIGHKEPCRQEKQRLQCCVEDDKNDPWAGKSSDPRSGSSGLRPEAYTEICGQAALVWGWELFNGNIPRCIKEWVKGIPYWPFEREPTVVSHSTVSPTYRCVSANKLKRNASKRRIYLAHGSAALSCSASNHRS